MEPTTTLLSEIFLEMLHKFPNLTSLTLRGLSLDASKLGLIHRARSIKALRLVECEIIYSPSLPRLSIESLTVGGTTDILSMTSERNYPRNGALGIKENQNSIPQLPFLDLSSLSQFYVLRSFGGSWAVDWNDPLTSLTTLHLTSSFMIVPDFRRFFTNCPNLEEIRLLGPLEVPRYRRNNQCTPQPLKSNLLPKLRSYTGPLEAFPFFAHLPLRSITFTCHSLRGWPESIDDSCSFRLAEDIVTILNHSRSLEIVEHLTFRTFEFTQLLSNFIRDRMDSSLKELNISLRTGVWEDDAALEMMKGTVSFYLPLNLARLKIYTKLKSATRIDEAKFLADTRVRCKHLKTLVFTYAYDKYSEALLWESE
ncbi:hypothetical protein JAAARDRAFT_288845 [Jaapia argillacea MUCL 33604]|uniref:F-box domain-containing protein n=1 Tax=Jaapia argillacea MUCL 33604 TaxID=933084 RepID=A0A067PQX4_9AGAM|nr:hypothetical protein JAAARDRAFT_288845 [Jaapia argillacea MUCL 33604]